MLAVLQDSDLVEGALRLLQLQNVRWAALWQGERVFDVLGRWLSSSSC